MYASRAEAQYARPATSIFDRGSIFMQTKDGIDVAAASVSRGYFVYMNPRLIVNPQQDYEALSEYVTVDKDTFLKDAESKGSYIELIHRLDEKTATEIQNLKLPGIGVSAEAWRSYPGGVLASHTLGLIGEDNNSTVKGRYGIERSYDDVLTRSAQGGAVSIFASLFSGIGSVFNSSADKQGDVITTMEPTVQTYLEKVLSDTDKEWHPDSIGGIIMNPQDGSIVALGSLPTFDPNNLSNIPNISVLSNPLVEHVYEMGSIFKPLTMAMALDTGAEKPDSTYDDVGCMVLNKKRICNWDGKARGVIPMQQILSQSLNIGAATIALKAGVSNMVKYFKSYGFDEPTGVDLPNEATGIMTNLTKQGQDIDVATASYGQGIAVSPMEMARALSILANGGYLVTPHVVKEIDHVDGTKKVLNWPKTGPVLKPQTVKDVDNMLIKVVDDALEYGKYKMDHYTMGAKTGTAEIADPVHGGYYEGRYLHSYFIFLPATNPRFIIFLYQVYPKGAEYASETLTIPSIDLAHFLINYYNIPPDR
jgi:cell division protein FtsI/penicillin-binding protein 2